jgi:hypothetical protein
LAKKNLTREEENKLFLATDNEGRTVFNLAVLVCKLEVFRGLFNWSINYLTTKELNKLFLPRDKEERTVFNLQRRYTY